MLRTLGECIFFYNIFRTDRFQQYNKIRLILKTSSFI